MKRRLATFALLLLTSTLATSCWQVDEDWSLCAVDNNLVLQFSIDDVPDAEFANHIDEFDVYLFDADRKFLHARKITAAEPDGIYRTTYTLDPGTYYAVSWGNTGTSSRLTSPAGGHDFENSTVEIAAADTGAPIYYAPNKTPEARTDTRAGDYSLYEIVVPNNETVVRQMVFGPVHRTIEVFISRYEETEGYDGKAPIVERSGARASYDFLLRADMTPRTLTREATPSGRDDATLSTVFHSALTPIQGDGWVRIIHPTTDEPLGEINIADYIAEYGIEDDSYIPIQFSFEMNPDPDSEMDVNVSVMMPDWMDNDLTPVIKD